MIFYTPGVEVDELIGKRFGRLVVLEPATRHPKSKQRRYLCLCDCGETKAIAVNSLRHGFTNSCGCIRRECCRTKAWKRMIEETGNVYGRLTVIGRAPTPIGKHEAHWHVVCECGTKKIVAGCALRSCLKSCGCANPYKFRDLTGQRFGKLVAISPSHVGEKDMYYHWNCVCDCGKTKVINGNNLRGGGSRSCGCGTGKGSLKYKAKMKEGI